MTLEAFLTSTTLVAVAEIGDKTQLLSFVLAARLRKPWAIIAGIFVATVLNHGLAGSVGVWLAGLIAPDWLPGITGGGFGVFGLWALHPRCLVEYPTIHPAGSLVKMELERPEGDRLRVEISRSVVEELVIRKGDQVSVRPTQLQTFEQRMGTVS